MMAGGVITDVYTRGKCKHYEFRNVYIFGVFVNILGKCKHFEVPHLNYIVSKLTTKKKKKKRKKVYPVERFVVHYKSCNVIHRIFNYIYIFSEGGQ